MKPEPHYKNNEELKDYISDLYSGGYNRYHEFEDNYDDTHKVKMLTQLMEHWDEMDEEGQSLIAVDGIGNFIFSKWCYFDEILPLVLYHADKSKIVEALEPLLVKGLFARDLLKLMVLKRKHVPKWEISIRNHWKEKTFKETFMDTDVTKMYQEINQLLKDLEA